MYSPASPEAIDYSAMAAMFRVNRAEKRPDGRRCTMWLRPNWFCLTARQIAERALEPASDGHDDLAELLV
jgi:hypothetical protein